MNHNGVSQWTSQWTVSFFYVKTPSSFLWIERSFRRKATALIKHTQFHCGWFSALAFRALYIQCANIGHFVDPSSSSPVRHSRDDVAFFGFET